VVGGLTSWLGGAPNRIRTSDLLIGNQLVGEREGLDLKSILIPMMSSGLRQTANLALKADHPPSGFLGFVFG
jgi:hypothetical protein